MYSGLSPVKPDVQKLKTTMLTSAVPTKSSIQSVPGSKSSPVVSAGLPRSAFTILPDSVAGRAATGSAAMPTRCSSVSCAICTPFYEGDRVG